MQKAFGYYMKITSDLVVWRVSVSKTKWFIEELCTFANKPATKILCIIIFWTLIKIYLIYSWKKCLRTFCSAFPSSACGGKNTNYYKGAIYTRESNG